MKITSNKNIFTAEYQEQLTNYIISAALDIYMLTGYANSLSIRTASDAKNFERRIEAQEEALKRCGDLTRLIFIAKPIFHLSSKRVKYWTGLTKETKGLIKAWSESDRKRSAHLFEI